MKLFRRKRSILKKKLEEIIHTHPLISKRFENAKKEGEVSGWGLPLGSLKRSVTGDNYLLTGDAGSLIDPFTGEGIGNALLSGMLAAETISQAIDEKNIIKHFYSPMKRNYTEVWKRNWI